MWFFKRRKPSQNPFSSGPLCPQCQSTETKVITHHGSGEEAYLKVWRGQRSVTYRCQKCGNDFYADESRQTIEIELNNDQSIDDIAALQTAEDQLKKQADDDNDHTFR